MAVQNKEQVFSLLRQHQGELRHLGVKRCGLFGSFARGQQQQQSDVDLLVEFETGKKTSTLSCDSGFSLKKYSAVKLTW